MKASTTRIETNIWLKEATKNITGDVLSIGTGDDRDLEGSIYRSYFKSAKSYTTSDISDRWMKHDLILDVRDMSSVESASYDAIFCACVIEHVDNFPAAISEMTRVLKPGGTLLINFAFRQHTHKAPSDFWRFTIPAIKYLLEPGYEIKEIKDIGAEIKDFQLLTGLSLPK